MGFERICDLSNSNPIRVLVNVKTVHNKYGCVLPAQLPPSSQTSRTRPLTLGFAQSLNGSISMVAHAQALFSYAVTTSQVSLHLHSMPSPSPFFSILILLHSRSCASASVFIVHLHYYFFFHSMS